MCLCVCVDVAELVSGVDALSFDIRTYLSNMKHNPL